MTERTIIDISAVPDVEVTQQVDALETVVAERGAMSRVEALAHARTIVTTNLETLVNQVADALEAALVARQKKEKKAKK